MIKLGKIPIKDKTSIVDATNKIRMLADDLRLSPITATKLATMTSELSSRMAVASQMSDINVALDKRDGVFGLVLLFTSGQPIKKFALSMLRAVFDVVEVSRVTDGLESIKTFNFLPDSKFKPTKEFIAGERELVQRLTREELYLGLKEYSEKLEVMVEERTKELRNSEEKIREVFESIPDSISVIDWGGVITETNQRTVEMHGFSSKNELLGKNAMDLVTSSDQAKIAKNMRKALKKGLIRDVECTLLRADGSELPCELSTSALKDASGNPVGYVTIAKDITERKQMQERLLTSERLATLGQFSGSISHELRNPLGVIDSSVYYLNTKLKDTDEKVQEHLDRIKSSVGSATAIIENLLNLTRMKDPQRQRLDLIAVTADAINTFRVPATVNVAQNFPDREVLVNADREQLLIAFENIVKNAVEAMDGEGMLTVTVQMMDDSQAEVSFADTGRGIAAEHLEKVFQPLFSTKANGFGFGLSLAKMVIDKHDGTIEAKSEPGKGVTIVVQFPLCEGEYKKDV
jgi:PAS domain S-box-containing protein